MNYSMKDVSNRTHLSAHTLRYYEKMGILTNVRRTDSGIRYYTDDDLEMLSLVRCLKDTGMPLCEIAEFIQLTHLGDASLSERCRILRLQREKLLMQMEEIHLHLKKINRKLDYYCALEREHSIEQAKMNT